MNRRMIFLILGSLGILGAVFLVPLSAQQNPKQESAISSQATKKKYDYGKSDIADIHFFPVEKARWNGYEVRASEWDQLTEFLKMRFLQDARTEIEVHENSVILISDMNRLVKAMDVSLRELQSAPTLKDMPVIKFFYIMLLQHNAIKKAKTLVKLSKAERT